ncbi:hypothetical protein K474DRAFT_1665421 [Panus rudis PR-1116 ss-1]|nr:hypothetical protein K474DRAFT_1665421 [Panus rudis PR-1116 ss-1]
MEEWLPLVPGCKRAVGKTLGSRVRIPQENHFDPQRFDQTLKPNDHTPLCSQCCISSADPLGRLLALKIQRILSLQRLTTLGLAFAFVWPVQVSGCVR